MPPDESLSFNLVPEFRHVWKDTRRYKRTLDTSNYRSFSIGNDDDRPRKYRPPLSGLFQISSVTYGGRCIEVTRENLATDSINTAARRRVGLTSVAWPVACARQSVMVTDRGNVRGPMLVRVCASAGEGGFFGRVCTPCYSHQTCHCLAKDNSELGVLFTSAAGRWGE